MLLTHFSRELVARNFYQHNINCGGCARAAFEFYKFFKKQPEIKILGFKALSDVGTNKISIKKVSKNKQDVSEHFAHVVLLIEHNDIKYIVDAVHGVVTLKNYSLLYFRGCKRMTGYIPPKTLREYCKRRYIWNRRFDVEDIKHVRQFLKSYKPVV